MNYNLKEFGGWWLFLDCIGFIKKRFVEDICIGI